MRATTTTRTVQPRATAQVVGMTMVLPPGSAQGPPTKPGTALRARKLPTSSTDAAAEPGEALSIGASARCATT